VLDQFGGGLRSSRASARPGHGSRFPVVRGERRFEAQATRRGNPPLQIKNPGDRQRTDIMFDRSVFRINAGRRDTQLQSIFELAHYQPINGRGALSRMGQNTTAGLLIFVCSLSLAQRHDRIFEHGRRGGLAHRRRARCSARAQR